MWIIQKLSMNEKLPTMLENISASLPTLAVSICTQYKIISSQKNSVGSFYETRRWVCLVTNRKWNFSSSWKAAVCAAELRGSSKTDGAVQLICNRSLQGANTQLWQKFCGTRIKNILSEAKATCLLYWMQERGVAETSVRKQPRHCICLVALISHSPLSVLRQDSHPSNTF